MSDAGKLVAADLAEMLRAHPEFTAMTHEDIAAGLMVLAATYADTKWPEFAMLVLDAWETARPVAADEYPGPTETGGYVTEGDW